MESSGITNYFPDLINQNQVEQKQFKTYTEVFEMVFPYFLSIGMTYEQFWIVGSDKFNLVTYYKEAEEIRRKRVNEEQWWNSIYLRRTLLDVSAAFRDFHKGNKIDVECSTKEPMPMSETEIEERKKRDEQRRMNEFMNYIIDYGETFNAKKRKQDREKKLLEKQVEENQVEQVETKQNKVKPIKTIENEVGGVVYSQLDLFNESESD